MKKKLQLKLKSGSGNTLLSLFASGQKSIVKKKTGLCDEVMDNIYPYDVININVSNVTNMCILAQAQVSK